MIVVLDLSSNHVQYYSIDVYHSRVMRVKINQEKSDFFWFKNKLVIRIIVCIAYVLFAYKQAPNCAAVKCPLSVNNCVVDCRRIKNKRGNQKISDLS